MDLMIDNNIVLDHILDRQPHAEKSRLVCLLGITGEARTFISVNMFTDLFYVLRKEYGSERAQEILDDELSFLQWVGISPEDAKRTLAKRWPDFEDALVAECASKINADYIITRDEKDFARSPIKAISPEQLFETLDEQGLHYEETLLDI